MRVIPVSFHSSPSLVALTLAVAILGTAMACVPALGQESAQAAIASRPLINQLVDESQLTTLRGNTHPLARSEYDLGTAPASLPMERMLLVLKRSPEQEFALRRLLDDQQDKESPNYHKWLTPEEYGRQFGPTDSDMQIIMGWLQSHGFQIAAPSKGRSVLEFSGSASQVQEAFHTTIHKYLVNGEQHWANDRDPSIPTALTPAVAGVDSLHNFGRYPMVQVSGVATREKATGRITAKIAPEFTFPGSCNSQDSNCYVVGPYDFATIYNVLPQWTAGIDGTGQRIAIVQETNINIADPHAFRALFGLPTNDPTIVLNGPDPGDFAPGSGLESEADIDVEWSGAVAKGATIDLVVSAPTDTTAGIDLSAEYIVENNLDGIMSESFGICEPALGAGGTAFYGSLWEQAAAQGISVFVSSGDQGSAVCDRFQGIPPQPAVNGLAVNGIASTPFNVAVGGTDFQDVFNPETYWNLTNDANQASAKGYIPETTWNSTCTNALFAQATGGSNNAETNCNNPSFANFVTTNGGSGGASIAWTKPSWQTGTGVPADGARDLPDASLFASSGFQGNAYIFCQGNISPSGSCDLNSPYTDFGAAGGTSFGSPAMAGIMALVNQKMGGRQGNPNYAFYKLAAQTPASSCNSETGPAGNCIFNDIPALSTANPLVQVGGTIRVPCAKGSPNCTTSVSTDAYGIIGGYDTTTGFDLATGLGTINVNNMVNQWHTAIISASTTTLTIGSGPFAHGASVPVQITAAHASGGTGTPTGDVSLIAETGPGTASQGVQEFTLSGGTVSSTTNLLPGGTYKLKAHYAGDSTFLGSDSTTTTVTVNPEGSTTTLICNPSGSAILTNCASTLDPNSNFVALTGGGSIPYGDLVYLHAAVAGASGNGIPTGTVTFNDSPAIPGNPYPLSSDGSTVTPAGLFNLPAGNHSITATYNHDASYNTSTSPALAFTIAKASSSVTVTPAQTTIPSGGTDMLTANITLGTAGLASYGNGPTGTVTFYSNGTALGTPATVTGTAGSANFIIAAGTPATGTASMTTAPGALATGTDNITAVYNGDSNYAASSMSPAVPVNVQAPDFSLSANTVTVSQGSSAPVTITVTPIGNFTGAVTNFTCSSGLPAETTCGAANPATVNGGSGPTTIQITTTPLGQARQTRRAANETRRTGWMATTMLSLLGLCLIGIPLRRHPRATLASLMILTVVLLPSCGGGGGGGTPPNPVPSISSLSPTQQAAGSQSQTLTINGTGFISSSTVTYNGTAHTATLVSGTQLTISLTASDMAATGSYPVVVTNPAPGGGSSSPTNFSVVTGTPVGSFTVTVTATSGTPPNQLQHNTTFTLTVQ